MTKFSQIAATLGVTLIFSVSLLAQSKVAKTSFSGGYNEETDRTSVYLNAIPLAGSKEDFKIGAAFDFKGRELSETPCCMVIFFTRIGRKSFRFKENNDFTLWADKEKFTSDDVIWKESEAGFAFIIAGIAFPEEVFVGIKTEIFKKIVTARKVKVELGDFKFDLSDTHLRGFRELLEKMRPASTLSKPK